jgi:two-component system response regulator NreC
MNNSTLGSKIKILIADDFLLLRTAWRILLETNPEFEVVGTAADGVLAVDFIKKNRNVDVVLMDISMPNMNGIDATTEICKIDPAIKVIALSMHNEFHYINKIIRAGGKGYVSKSVDKEELFRAIYDVYNNISYLSPITSNKIIEKLDKNGGVELKSVLSFREINIIKLIIEGKTSKEIGEQLFISPKTVDTYKNSIFKKLNVHNTASMTKKVLEEGIIIM